MSGELGLVRFGGSQQSLDGIGFPVGVSLGRGIHGETPADRLCNVLPPGAMPSGVPLGPPPTHPSDRPLWGAFMGTQPRGDADDGRD